MLKGKLRRYFYLVREGLQRATGKEDEGLALIRRLEKAEQDFQQAYRLLSNLSDPKNREKVAEIFQKAGIEISEKDLHGAILVPPESIKQEFRNEYGLKAFPLILSFPKLNWKGKEGIAVKLGIGGKGGVFIHDPYKLPAPFKNVGIGFIEPNYISERHETLHGVEAVYKERYKTIEQMILSEIFTQIKHIGKPSDWLNLMDIRWNVWIEHYGKGANKKEKYRIAYKIKRALQGLAYLQLKTSSSIVAQTILNSRNLDELASWKQTKLRKYENPKGDRRSEEMFCRDAIRTYQLFRGIGRKETENLLYSYNFAELKKEDIKNILDEEYSRPKSSKAAKGYS
ncbi:hypothetical protein HZA33_00615 [Candidatus Pacearchaeota archaeon]|nr:hypothetical protein [Candidatus Pacearchaeota archaeon]